jgi:uncharacterized protein YjbI with pentapeptide repeats
MNKRQNFWILMSMFLVVLTIGFILIAYHFNWIETGFQNKTLWDWLQLLIVPLALALIAFLFNRTTSRTEQKIATQRYEQDQNIALDKQHEDLLQTYLDRMSELLLEKQLGSSPSDAVKNVARVRTTTVLFQLDARRIGYVFAFLREAGLMSNTSESIVSLKDANLSNINFSQASIALANLEGAHLEGANLEGANLEGANLEGANLSDAHLSDAHLEGANLSRTDLRRTDLSGAHLNGDYLVRVNLSRVDLSEVNLSGVDLEGANLYKANLSRANLLKANLSDANLYYAHLKGADFRDANLKGADFRDADTWNAHFTLGQFPRTRPTTQ